MLPLLRWANDKKEHSLSGAIEYISTFFNMTQEEKRKTRPNGHQPIIDNRVNWAKTYLTKAKLLCITSRGYFEITERGSDVLRQNPSEISPTFLMQFAEFAEFQERRKE